MSDEYFICFFFQFQKVLNIFWILNELWWFDISSFYFQRSIATLSLLFSLKQVFSNYSSTSIHWDNGFSRNRTTMSSYLNPSRKFVCIFSSSVIGTGLSSCIFTTTSSGGNKWQAPHLILLFGWYSCLDLAWCLIILHRSFTGWMKRNLGLCSWKLWNFFLLLISVLLRLFSKFLEFLPILKY